MFAGMEIGEISLIVAIEMHGDCTNTLMASAEDHLSHLKKHLNIPTQKWQNLLAELSNALENDKVSAAFWACVQICNIDQLQKIVHQASADPTCVSIIINSCKPLIQMWKQWPPGSFEQVSEASSLAQFSASANFNQSHLKDLAISSWLEFPASSNFHLSCPTKLALKQDDKCCVFTKVKLPDTTHIYSYCLINSQVFGTAPARLTPGFWELLQNFWTREQV